MIFHIYWISSIQASRLFHVLLDCSVFALENNLECSRRIWSITKFIRHPIYVKIPLKRSFLIPHKLSYFMMLGNSLTQLLQNGADSSGAADVCSIATSCEILGFWASTRAGRRTGGSIGRRCKSWELFVDVLNTFERFAASVFGCGRFEGAENGKGRMRIGLCDGGVSKLVITMSFSMFFFVIS